MDFLINDLKNDLVFCRKKIAELEEHESILMDVLVELDFTSVAYSSTRDEIVTTRFKIDKYEFLLRKVKDYLFVLGVDYE